MTEIRTEFLHTTIENRHGTAAEWLASTRILRDGEIGFESDTNKHKIGNGHLTWAQLPYFLSEAYVVALINAAIDAVNAGTGDIVTQETLQAHIDSLEPHPVYDDMQSLVLLYQNATV